MDEISRKVSKTLDTSQNDILTLRQAEVKDYSPELLQQTATLLDKNPEYYTIWNIRRRIFTNEFNDLADTASDGQITADSKHDQVRQIIQLDLQFLFPLLLRFPKCYWIWNHRLWLLEQSLIFLPTAVARAIWEDELNLVGKMLARDSRNFHGWGYRRTVIQNLESSDLDGSSMARKEYDYTTKMVGSNLSNFSAWHNRTKLLTQILDEEQASGAERQDMLDKGAQRVPSRLQLLTSAELNFVHETLFDPYDQSLWFYHQNLMAAFDPDRSSKSIAPELSAETRLEYVRNEQEFIGEVLEDADDCKWAYQALIDCTTIEAKLKGGATPDTRTNIRTWLQKLKELDPLRSGRWADMEASLM